MSKLLFLERFRGKVDREKAIIYGVSLISVGPAKGHDMDIDDKTLSQVLKLIPEVGLKAKINHRDAAGVRSINGRHHNARKEEGSIRVDWHLNKKHPDTDWILTAAEDQPEDFGISITCKATTAPGVDGRKKMRVSELKSGDLVDDPASNDSLLEQPVDTPADDMTLEELSKKIDDLGTRLGACEKFNTELSKALEDDEENDSPESGKELSELGKAVGELSLIVKAQSETLKTLSQKPAPVSGSDNPNNATAKTQEEIQLEAKMKTAKDKLDTAKGLTRYELANKYEKDFGKDWKSKLVELQAKK